MAVDRDKTLQAAQKLVDKKKYDKAILEYRKLVADDAGDVRTLLKIGDLHLKLDQFEDAIGTYEQVGEYYFREGFSVKAIAVYKQVRGIINRHCQHLESKYGHIVPRLAEIYTELGLTSDALGAYDEVATRMRQEGRERDALDIFKKVVELDPQNPIAHLRVADSRARLGDIDKAVDAFGKAARIMLELNRLDDALKVLERLLEYRQDPEYARLAGLTYLERSAPNDGMAALSKLQIAFKANPKDPDTLSVLARAFDAINQPKKAIEVMKESARVARDKGHEADFVRITDLLASRAPDDAQVKQFVAQLHGKAHGAAAGIAIDEPEVVEDLDSIEEVFELAEQDLHTTGVGNPFGASDDDSAARQLVMQAEAYRASGHVHQAVELLKHGIADRSPGAAMQVRMKLADLLLEAGDARGAVSEKFLLARQFEEAGARDRAAQVLDEVLLLYPSHPGALQMRHDLGYHGAGYAAPSHGDPFGELPLNLPLQSYDLESGGIDEALRSTAAGTGAHRLDEHGHHHGFADGSAAAPALAARKTNFNSYLPASQAAILDERALEEADLLADLGRHDEARRILWGQLQLLPNHPLILDRLADLDALSGAAATESTGHHYEDPSRLSWLPLDSSQYPAHHPPNGNGGYPAAPNSSGYPPNSYEPQSGAYPSVQHVPDYQSGAYAQSDASQYPSHYGQAPLDPAAQPYSQDPYQSGAYDQAASGGYEAYAAPPLAAAVDGGQVAETDAQGHYDLGVAYMEMGIIADAIAELTLAAYDPNRECICLSMIASIHLQTGDIDAGLDALHRALNAQNKTREQQLAIGYEIANSYELRGMAEQALHYFEWLTQLEPNYLDPRGALGERIERLRHSAGPH